MGAGDAAPAEAEQQEEAEEEIVANFALAPESAAGGAPEEFPLTTGDSFEAEVRCHHLLSLQSPKDEADIAAAEGAAADVEVEDAGSCTGRGEQPLAYHPISSVLARPTILRPAVTRGGARALPPEAR